MIELDFKKGGGLIPAIAQDVNTGKVLMLAYMNRESFEKTLKTGKAHYWSRSRNKFWMKGETSGNIQLVKEVRVDCDSDCVLLKVQQVGDAACHTGYRSCFHQLVNHDRLEIDGSKIFDPQEKYGGSRG